MRTRRSKSPKVSWFRERHQAYSAILSLEDCLRTLSKMATTGADALSIARAAVPLYLDLIRRALWLFGYIDAIAFDVLEEECLFQEKMRRVMCVLQIESMVADLMCKAFDGLLLCLGGKEAIAIQTIAGGIASQRAGTGGQLTQPFSKLIE